LVISIIPQGKCTAVRECNIADPAQQLIDVDISINITEYTYNPMIQGITTLFAHVTITNTGNVPIVINYTYYIPPHLYAGVENIRGKLMPGESKTGRVSITLFPLTPANDYICYFNVSTISRPDVNDSAQLLITILKYYDATCWASIIERLEKKSFPWDIYSVYAKVSIRNECNFDIDGHLLVYIKCRDDDSYNRSVKSQEVNIPYRGTFNTTLTVQGLEDNRIYIMYAILDFDDGIAKRYFLAYFELGNADLRYYLSLLPYALILFAIISAIYAWKKRR